jgi:peptidoglycan/xylan/chitin deacetylase (PgdA/CDA1 family)/folate-dependent phosphoribosylglycinamide formyltransferase PurN
MRVVIFSGANERSIHQLIRRIRLEVPEALVVGVLSERRPGRTPSQRVSGFLKNLRHWSFAEYAAARLARTVSEKIADRGHALLRLIHGGGPAVPCAPVDPVGLAFQTTTDYHCDESLEFVRGLQPDLGLVYGTRILKPCLFAIPRRGSINIHKRKVPDYRGGGPVGLWELLDEQSEIGVTVHQVVEQLDAGDVVKEATIPIEPFDSLTSLALKAHVVANDLLVAAVRDYARGTVQLQPQKGTGRTFKAPSPAQLARYEKELSRRRPGFRPVSSRTLVKLVLKTLIGLPRVTLGNWHRRRRRSFPVNILFHHLISDRAHRMGMSTDCFLRHVRFLQRHYQVVSLRDALGMLRANRVERPTVVLTFDDGYEDNFINLRAVVEETGVPVTMFVCTDCLDEQLGFKHDTDDGIHGFAALRWAQLSQMQQQGFEIGSHTRSHFDCGSADLTALRHEIVGAKEVLERRLMQPIEFFSFPFGLPENISPEAIEIASATYPHFFSAFGGNNPPTPGVSPRHLKRWGHPGHLWDLELQLQGVLEPEPEFTIRETNPPAVGNQLDVAAQR